MLQMPRRKKAGLQAAVDAFCVAVSVVAVGSLQTEVSLFALACAATILSTVAIAVFQHYSVYRAWVRYLAPEIGVVVLVLSLTLTALAAVLYRAAVGVWPEGGVALNLAALLLLAVSAPRLVARAALLKLQDAVRERVVIYGAGSAGRELAAALQTGEKYAVVAFVDDDHRKTGSMLMGVPVVGPHELPSIAARREVEKVLLAMPHLSVNRRREILEPLCELNLTVQTIPSFPDLVQGEARVDQLRFLDAQDLLGRDVVPPMRDLIEHDVRNRVVLVTGAGGSIGSELARQAYREQARKLILLDHSELALYEVERDLYALGCASVTKIVPVLASVLDEEYLQRLLAEHKVETVYHAAAYKHVPMVERNIIAGVKNNVIGTWHAARAAAQADVESFVLVSSDKAVRPTNVMGASKRVAELAVQALAKVHSRTRYSIVRFGNVLSSSGSVVPLFREQIASGGPVTVTDKDVIRYFMTIPEAAQLVIQAGAQGRKAEVFVLDMGEPVAIYELAQKMIRLAGFTPILDEDSQIDGIKIELQGLRPGEKLYEELLLDGSERVTRHERIRVADEPSVSLVEFEGILADLDSIILSHDTKAIMIYLSELPIQFNHSLMRRLDEVVPEAAVQQAKSFAHR